MKDEELLTSVLDKLLRIPSHRIELDQIGDAFGLELARTELIEEVFARLEAAGKVIGLEEARPPAELLKACLGAARRLRQAGRPSGPAEIAAEAGLPLREVKVALLFAEVLKRGTVTPAR